MTTHLKTTEWCFAANTASLAANTVFTFSAITLSIPETTGLVFKSVYLEFYWRSNATTTVYNTTTITVQLNAITAGSFTQAFANTSDGIPVLANKCNRQDVTAYFTTNWTGSSMTVTPSFKNQGMAVTNLSCRLVVTYQYDDANTTRCKTVRIPLEGYNGVIPTALTQVGGASEIPNLSTFCPEASKTFASVFFEVYTRERYPTAGTAQVLTLALDAEAGAACASHSSTGILNAGDSSLFTFLWQRNDMTTGATHALKAKGSSATTAQLVNLSVVLVVTYTYDHAATTTVLNSLVLPYATHDYESPYIRNVGHKAFFTSDFSVQEGSPTLVQSGALLLLADYFSQDAADAMSVQVGTQTTKVYTDPGFAIFAAHGGPLCFAQRVDSAAAQGAGLAIARGDNQSTVAFWITSGTSALYQGSQSTLYLYLNYTSSKHALGDGVHNHTVKWCQTSTTEYLGSPLVSITAAAPTVPESNWWVSSFSLSVSVVGFGGPLAASLLAGERTGTGWANLTKATLVNASTTCSPSEWGASSKLWDRFAGELDTWRMNPFSARDYDAMPIVSNSLTWLSFGYLFTYHAITYTVAGAVVGFTGAGSGIVVDILRADNYMRAAQATTAAGGSYTATVYDNVNNVFAEAIQDGTHFGRSTDGVGT